MTKHLSYSKRADTGIRQDKLDVLTEKENLYCKPYTVCLGDLQQKTATNILPSEY